MRELLLSILMLCSVNVFAQRTIFQHVNVIPMDEEIVLKDYSVIVVDGKIQAIGKNLKAGKDDIVINGSGKFLMPGLAEMHAHVPPIDDLEPMKEVVELFVLNGITTIRGMLGHPRHLELRELLKKGEVLGPRLYTTGPSFNGMSVTSPEAGAEMVEKQKALGYDYLKLHPGLTRAEFDAIAETAHELKIPFVGHVSFGVGVWRAIESHYSSIDHLDGFVEGLVPGIETMAEQETGLFGMFVADRADESRIPELVSGLKQNKVWIVPTQSLAERWFSPQFTVESFRNDPTALYMKSETVEQWISAKQNLLNNPKYDSSKANAFIKLRRKLILECHKGGVDILLGCDAPQIFNVPGFSTHQELIYLVNSGLTPFQALRAGTANVARYLGTPQNGTIKPGASADLILLNANPLENIRNTQTIRGVMVRGKWLSSEFITGELARLKKR